MMVETDLFTRAKCVEEMLRTRLTDVKSELKKYEKEMVHYRGNVAMSVPDTNVAECDSDIAFPKLPTFSQGDLNVQQNNFDDAIGSFATTVEVARDRVHISEEDIQNVPAVSEAEGEKSLQHVHEFKGTVPLEDDCTSRLKSELLGASEELKKVNVELLQTKQKLQTLMERSKCWRRNESRMTEMISNVSEQLHECQSERDYLKVQVALNRDRLVFLERKGPLPASYRKNDGNLHEKLLLLEKKLRGYERILKEKGLRNMAGIPRWTFVIAPQKGVSDYGELVLGDVDEDCLMDVLRITEDVLQLMMEKFKGDKLKKYGGEGDGLNCSAFPVLHTAFFNDINDAESNYVDLFMSRFEVLLFKLQLLLVIMQDEDDEITVPREKNSVLSEHDGNRDRRKLIEAPKPLHWQEGKDWGKDEVQNDFDDRVLKCCQWAAKEYYENELYWGWSNNMFKEHIKGIFFPISVR